MPSSLAGGASRTVRHLKIRPRALLTRQLCSKAEASTHKPTALNSLEADTSSSWGSNVRGLGHNNYLGKILNARVYEAARETPLQSAPILSARLGNTILIKREDLQPVFSFKIRGAYNKIAQLSREQLRAGIVACSAGNHAQGVALSAATLGTDAVIVMPKGTPAIKVDAVQKLHGNVLLHGSSYDEAQAEAMRLVELEGRTLIHPFDDPLVIAGQGTIGMEILKQTTGKQLDAVFVCCGGGGMLAGIAAYIKRVRPGVMVIGVEAADAAGMTESIRAGKRTTLDTVGIFADGAAVKTVGQETFRICNELVDEMVTVSTDEICAAIKDGFTETRCVLEPAGALAIAGVKRWVELTNARDLTFVVTASGANMDFDRLRFVSERADSSETMISVTIPERAGSFRSLIGHIEPRNVTEFSYRMRSGDAQQATVYLSFQARGSDGEERLSDAGAVIAAMRADGLHVSDLRENEMAKGHLRYLGGGRASVAGEHLFRFEFPERPGALVHFLDSLRISSTDCTAPGWNVSLFQYRNHGADIGRVLAGLQVPPEQEAQLETFLSKLGFNYSREDDNAVSQQFL
mmetsp:Transcript_33168/g.65978  ORF Transcript_33168/g.65978 Transcript_33168/m.65978 type:complete len:576 (-) Transcript_33168:315-2042(-)|eukprot:CAMPEP_0174737388 /NCGR_PEP_ID=MMETSP1094-20130205/68250_1 /TAXON_ID=156173 /ORGANISM="Chrysochromulina brevifilum, Strain UTEX LB 985" /LENGTH=575 /DNA_ID=CAMNT_0015940613 /DNA_START=53 /DNA_END=1780 /DNA_ORIENTATION=+